MSTTRDKKDRDALEPTRAEQGAAGQGELPSAEGVKPKAACSALQRGGTVCVDLLLALPLFYKVLIANSAIVLAGALVGTAITARVASPQPHSGLNVPLATAFALVGLALTFALNALVLRAALR